MILVPKDIPVSYAKIVIILLGTEKMVNSVKCVLLKVKFILNLQ